MKTIIVDTREHPRAIRKILGQFEMSKVNVVRSKMIVGDYQRFDVPTVVVDRKQNLDELVKNLGSDRRRFMDEVRLASSLGVKLYVLCEHGRNVRSIEDVGKWQNPRLSPKNPHYAANAMTGRDLMERIYTVHISYGVEFLFCDKVDTGSKIIDILGVA